MSIFSNVKFYTTVNNMKDLPPTMAEIAFVGRSNAGKSSAINTLANRTRLAYVSKTPGRTQHINFFELTDDHYLVDLPGYGYAEVPEKVRKHWEQLLGRYLESRKSLVGLLLIMDSRRPLLELDWQMLNFFLPTGRPVHILLSKADKLSRQEQNATLKKVKAALSDYPQVSIQLFSSLKKHGLKEVEVVVDAWLHPEEAQPEPTGEASESESAPLE